MTDNEIVSKLHSIHLGNFVNTFRVYNGGDTYSISVSRNKNEAMSEYLERKTGVEKRLQMAFILVSSETDFQNNVTEIEFTYGLNND